MKDFGITIPCYSGDLPLARGCVASIRHFMGDVPICLICDGDFSTKDLERTYGVTAMRKRDVKNPDLRTLSFGFGLTKLIAFWEGPFERMLSIDADAVVWGDIRKNLPTDDWDLVYNEPHEVITSYIQKTQYFDPEKIFKHIPPFKWEGSPFFQAGIVGVKRGALDLQECITMLKLQRIHPDVFINGDQGLLNILAFRAISENRLKAYPAHLQTVVPVFSREQVAGKFPCKDQKEIGSGNPTIIHWAGPKPWNSNPGIYGEPMNYFRRKALRDCGHWLANHPELALSWEEFKVLKLRKWRMKLTRVKARLKAGFSK